MGVQVDKAGRDHEASGVDHPLGATKRGADSRDLAVHHRHVANGIRYMEKAPMLYWSLAASYRIFGIGEWSAHLPLMLAVLALVLATYVLGRYVYGEAGGLYAGIALVTSLGIYIYTRFLIPEVMIALWLTLGYYFFLRALEEEQNRERGFGVPTGVRVQL